MHQSHQQSSLSFLVLVFLSLYTAPARIPYPGLEVQWMLLTILFILGSSVHRGTYNSSIFNAVLSIRSVISILWSNSLSSIIGSSGKIGYFPISLLFSPLPHSPSHRSSIPDSINKLAYFGSFLLIVHHSISNNSFSHRASTLNVFIILFLIKLLASIKQIILISSILNYLFIIALLYFMLFHYLLITNSPFLIWNSRNNYWNNIVCRCCSDGMIIVIFLISPSLNIGLVHPNHLFTFITFIPLFHSSKSG